MNLWCHDLLYGDEHTTSSSATILIYKLTHKHTNNNNDSHTLSSLQFLCSEAEGDKVSDTLLFVWAIWLGHNDPEVQSKLHHHLSAPSTRCSPLVWHVTGRRGKGRGRRGEGEGEGGKGEGEGGKGEEGGGGGGERKRGKDLIRVLIYGMSQVGWHEEHCVSWWCDTEWEH